MINRYLLLLIVLTGLSSCAAEVRLPFEIMDETELAWYNASSSFDEQIICREQIEGWQIFSGAVSFREEIKGSQRVGIRRMGRYRHDPKFCLSVRELKYRKLWGGVSRYGTFDGSMGVESWQPADAADYPSTFN